MTVCAVLGSGLTRGSDHLFHFAGNLSDPLGPVPAATSHLFIAFDGYQGPATLHLPGQGPVMLEIAGNFDVLVLQVTTSQSGTARLTLPDEAKSPPSSHSWFLSGMVKGKEKNRQSPAEQTWLNAFRLLEQGKENPGPLLKAARVLAGSQQWQEAMATGLKAANNLWQQREHNRALTQVETLRAQIPATERGRLRALLEFQAGSYQAALGYLSDAIDSFGQAASLFSALGLRSKHAQAHHAIGNVHVITGDLTQAESAYNQALTLFDTPDPKRLYTQLELGWLARRRNQFDQAISVFRDLIPRAQAAQDDYLVLETYDRLGSTLGLAGRFTEGEQALKHSLALIGDYHGDRQALQGVAHLNLAFLYRHWHKPEQTLRHADKALQLYSTDQYQEGRVTIHWTKGSALLALNRPLEALAQFEQCIESAEAIRAKSRNSPEGLQFFQMSFLRMQDLFHLYRQLHEQYPDGGYDRRALWHLERVRARGLYENLAAQKDQRPTTSATLTRLRNIANPRQRFPSLENHNDRGSIASAETLLARLRKGVLGPGSGVLAYFLGEDRGYWWLVSSDDFAMGPVPGRQVLAGKIQALRQGLEQPNLQASVQQQLQARELAQLILPDHPAWTQLKQIYLVPDGPLHHLPFVMLEDNGAQADPAEASERNEDSLRRWVIWPSISTGLHMAEGGGRGHAAPKQVLALADPIFAANDPRLPTPVRRPQAPDSWPERLPQSSRELAMLRQLGLGLPIQAFSGADASKARFLSLPLAEFPLLHLATHALSVPEQPGLSGLVFSLFDAQGQPRDGYLTSAEVAQLDLHAQLVVLSACRSAEGPLFLGEGMLGLARAFLAAGSRAVLASLWDVDDAATAMFMHHFYRELFAGHSSAAALRKAQHVMAAGKAWSAPRYWAGFVLIGAAEKIF